MAPVAAAVFAVVLGIRMLMAARAVTVMGDRRVVRTGSQVGNGRDREIVRDHERLFSRCVSVKRSFLELWDVRAEDQGDDRALG